MNNRIRQMCRAFTLATKHMRVHMEMRFPVYDGYSESGTMMVMSCYPLTKKVPAFFKRGYRFSDRREYVSIFGKEYVL